MSTSWLSAEVLNHDPDMRKQSCDLCISRFSTPVQESVSSVQRAKEQVLKETQIHQLWGPSNLQSMWQCNEPSFHLNRCLSIIKLSWDNPKASWAALLYAIGKTSWGELLAISHHDLCVTICSHILKFSLHSQTMSIQCCYRFLQTAMQQHGGNSVGRRLSKWAKSSPAVMCSVLLKWIWNSLESEGSGILPSFVIDDGIAQSLSDNLWGPQHCLYTQWFWAECSSFPLQQVDQYEYNTT